MYNSHIHTFRDIDVPRKFLPLGLVRFLATRTGCNLVTRLLNRMNPFSNDDLLDRYARLITIGRLGSQKAIFEECMRFYPRDSLFAALSMDLAFMGAGKVPRDYADQLKELSRLKEMYPQIIPFIHVDPRRPGVFDLMRKSFEEWGFGGVKIYPLTGHFPYDERLYPVYDYCLKYGIPVIAHASPVNAVHFRGSWVELDRLLSDSKIPVEMIGSKRNLCANFADPRNWNYILNDFPGLKVCLAHFGSGSHWQQYLDDPGRAGNWFVYIKNMIPRYENLYTDIAFTLNDYRYFPLLKVLMNDPVLRERILFGSDYYMVETETSERRFSIDLRAFLGEDYFRQIAWINPGNFFGKQE